MTSEDVKCPQCGCYKTEALNSKWRRCKKCRHVFERQAKPCEKGKIAKWPGSIGA